MKRFLCLFLLVFAAACQTVPITGRKQISLVSNTQITQLSSESYQQMLKESEIVRTGAQADLVRKVGAGIAKAAEDFLRENGLESEIVTYSWEFNLIKDDNTVNAFCMPGGKIAVYTGILPVTKNEEGLAVVMGHEVAHAIAKHGAERMSQSLLVDYGGVSFSYLISDRPQESQQLLMAAYGAGTQVGIMLPYSRKHELEADRIGLVLMARAGYNPATAVTFWQDMSSGKSGGSDILSTHPSDSRRIDEIKKLLAEAMPYYKKNNG